MRNMPQPYDVYRHKRTHDLYTVITMANVDAKRIGWPPTVVYEDKHERVWSRPWSEFREKTDKVSPDEVNI